jgi:8-oxo-dGTP pyrophosphatase MutT (NUDIX family)
MNMSHPNYRVAVEAVIYNEGKVLLTKRSDDALVAPGVWNVPAGKVKYEEVPKDAVLRECAEETNLNVDIVAELGTGAFKTKVGDEEAYRLAMTYLVKPKEGETIDNMKLNEEHSEAEWVDVKDVLNPRFDSIMPRLREIIAKIEADENK